MERRFLFDECGGTNLGGWMCVTLVRMPLVKEAIKDGYK